MDGLVLAMLNFKTRASFVYVFGTVSMCIYYMQCRLTLDVATVSTCGYNRHLVFFRNDECVKGGESIIVDSLAVLERLRHTHPQYFSTLARVPTNYHRIHDNRCGMYS